MLDATKDVQGVSLYAEFRKPGATMQIIVTPDGYNEEGKQVAGSLYRRVVTPSAPKKQWRSSSVSSNGVHDVIAASGQIEDSQIGEIAEQRLSFATQLFDGIIEGGWSITKKPLLIETSKKDLTDVRQGKTPNKLLYRVNLTKDAEGFPKELFS